MFGRFFVCFSGFLFVCLGGDSGFVLVFWLFFLFVFFFF